MTNETNITDRLRSELHAVIDLVDDGTLTAYQVIGALEIVKADFIEMLSQPVQPEIGSVE